MVSIRVGSRGSDALVETVRALDAASLETRGLAMRRPSLDDVFLALTGHAAEEAEEPGGRRRGAGAAGPGANRTRTRRGRGHDRGRGAAGVPGAPSAPGLPTRFRWAVSDTLTITRRNLIVWMRVPAYIVFTVIQPVMFVLMFRYVFGGAIPVKVRGGYVSFLMPGIIGQTAAFGSFGTAISLAQELKKGVIDRLRSMPMARSAVLAGRLVADTGRMTVTILIVLGVGTRSVSGSPTAWSRPS